MGKSAYEVQEEAKKAYEAAHPKPKLPVSNVPAPQVVRHTKGRLWLEVTGLIHDQEAHSWATESGIELCITLNDRAERVSIRADALALLSDEIVDALNNLRAVNAEKRAYLEAKKAWDEGWAKAGNDAVDVWRKAQPPSEKRSRSPK